MPKDYFDEDDVEQLAQNLFTAYNDEGPNPWKTWDGKDVPRWENLSGQVLRKWRAVARRALERLAPTR